MKRSLLTAIMILLLATPLGAQSGARRRAISRPDWRRDAVRSMRVASAFRLITDQDQLRAYTGAGFNTLTVYDVNGYAEFGAGWAFKDEDQIRAETSFAREKGLPLVLGMAVEPIDTPAGRIAEATDDEIRARVRLWKAWGDDMVIGIFPWYDDVFYHQVDVGRQLQISRLIHEIAPDWYVFGMVGEYGFKAEDDEVRLRYDPAAFDHLIVLMYPYDLCYALGLSLDHDTSADADADLTRYVDYYINGMEEKFFRHLRPGQMVVLVGQAFYYSGEVQGRIPRGRDIEIMMRRGTQRIRQIAGQEHNYSAAYFHWGAEGSGIVGLSERADWLDAVREFHASLLPELAAP